MTKENTYAEIWLPYFKQGDDLYECIEDTDTWADALEANAARFETVVHILREIREVVGLFAQEDINIDAGTHHIGISGPEELINTLAERELAHIADWEEEEWD